MAIALSETLKQQSSVDLSQLAWTLQAHRTKLKYRISVSATDRGKLITKLDEAIVSIDELQTPKNLSTGSQVRVLGVFTGQGAQWASMGASLFQNSALFRSTFEELDDTLHALPEGPTWSLADRLLHWDGPADQLPAEISQPICTAIQIALVDLLRACAISFTAVIGHSSGEIAAAYAAGVLTSSDAIIISYLRGYHCQRSSSKRSGKMMAVGMAAHDAQQFCRRRAFVGKLVVAAENSTSSTTLSGDADAIEDAKNILDEEKVYAKILKTDMAYHSHHMSPVKGPYCMSMHKARIKPKRNAYRGACSWYSTVYPPTSIDGNALSPTTGFDGSYWANNLTRPVLFSKGLIAALQENSFDLALEIGPHAALKAPATETIRGVWGDPLPYVGALERVKDAVETFSNAIGAIWCYSDTQTAAVDFAGLRKACDGVGWTKPRVSKQLPPYPWDHERSMVRESRKSYLWRTREPGRHEILGHPVSWGGNEWRWRNVLRLDDIEWLRCHQFQNQPLLPASAYIVAAIEAALRTVGNSSRPVQMIELQDVIIHNGIQLEADSPEVDLEFTMSKVEEDETGATLEFSCRFSNADSSSFDVNKKVVTGRIVVLLEAGDGYLLPGRIVPTLPLTDVALERFYHWMDKIGLQYSGPFLLQSIKRRLDIATVTTKTISHTVIHPATLDSVLQGLYAAFSYPGDGRIWSSYLPKSFRCIRLDIGTSCRISSQPDSELIADCFVMKSSPREISGDIDVFCLAEAQPVIQVQGIVLSSLETPDAAKDPTLLWRTVWMKDLLSIATSDEEHNEATVSAAETYERTAHSLLRQLLGKADRQSAESTSWYLSHPPTLASKLHHSMNQPCYALGDGQNQQQQQQETLMPTRFDEKHEAFHQIDLELLQQIEPRILSILQGFELQHTAETDRMPNQIHTAGLGAIEANKHLGTVIDHLVHRYPEMRILELSSGTGEYTDFLLQHLEAGFAEYLFTDSTDVGLSAARAHFAAHHPSLIFQVLDIEQPPTNQGFAANSYDLVIAAHALSLAGSVDDALQHCRQLLRPGGYLVILEMTNPNTLRNILQLSSLTGWQPGQKYISTLTEAEWDAKLRGATFSGVDVAFRDFKPHIAHGLSVMVTQAVDNQILALREPLTAKIDTINTIEKLVIVTSRTLGGLQMAHKLMALLRPFSQELVIIEDLSDASDIVWKPETAVISICDMEDPTFKNMSERKIAGMQSLFREAQYMLWATRGGYCDDPDGSISIGIGRTAARELPHLRVKFVDFESLGARTRHADANMLAEMLLQMMILDNADATSILWSNETEVSVREGIPLIPRVRLRRTWHSRPDLSGGHTTTSVHLNVPPCSLPIKTGPSFVTSSPNPSYNIVSSSLVKFKFTEHQEPCHISIVNQANEKTHALSLWPGHDGLVDIGSWPQDMDPDELLSLILLILVCESALSGCTGTVWIHNADPTTCETLSLVANRMRISIFLTTHDPAAKTSPASTTTAMYLHPRATVRSLKLLIPQSVRLFVNMEASFKNTSSTVDFALNFLDQELEIRSGFQNILVLEPVSLQVAKSEISSILSQYFTEPTILQNLRFPKRHVILRPGQLPDDQHATAATSVVSWSGAKSVSMIPPSPAGDDQLFGPDKTYFLVGLTGEVGLSLCEWMVDHGARNFALASRNPTVPPETISHLESKGATVRVFSLDVSNMENLVTVHREIISTMPPIAGVANGALVARDHPFDGLSFDDLTEVFKPKVVGSRNLDALFFTTPLDFFILFSSIATIYGKPGQSSYNGANMFMSAMTKKRRARGFAATTLHFGMMLGLGHVYGAAEASLESKFRQEDLMAVPESAFHQIFAQAVLSGRPGCDSGAEVIAGLGRAVDTPWRRLPRFAHCHLKSGDNLDGLPKPNKPGFAQDMKLALEKAGGREHALEILRESIGQRIGSVLGMAGERLDDNLALLSIGFDSLAAVEIRSWLRNTFQVNIPVLSFLSGATLLDICHEVLAHLSNSSRPGEDDHIQDPKADNNVSADLEDDDQSVSPALTKPIIAEAVAPSNHIVDPAVGQESGVLLTHDQTEEQREVDPVWERIGPMSHSQAQLYLIHQQFNNNAYNIAYHGTLHGRLDVSQLKEALKTVSWRHESLRSAYFIDEAASHPVQAVMLNSHIALEQLSNDSTDDRDLVQSVKKFRLNIERGETMKVSIITHSPTRHFMMFAHHHIVMDGLSWRLFISDLAAAYSGGMGAIRAAPRPQQPIELSKMHSENLGHRQNLESDLAFWRTIYKTTPEPLPPFPFSKTRISRPARPEYNVNVSNVKISNELSKLIDRASAKAGVTSFHFYLASFATFLSRCLNVSDLAIGVVDANRYEEAEMETIGNFLNMLPVRMQLAHAEPLITVARRVRDAVVAAMTHSHAPFDLVAGDLGLSRSSGHHPLFQSAMNYSSSSFQDTEFGRDGKIVWEGGVPGGHPYDLMLNVGGMTDGAFVSLIAQSSLYKTSEVELLLKWYIRALETLAHNPSIAVGACPIADSNDLQQVLDLGRGKDVDIAWDGTIIDRVSKMASMFPDSTAIIDEQGRAVTYLSMTERTSGITSLLRTVSPQLVHGSRIAMLLDPGADMISCVLSVLGNGHTWIPLDTLNHHLRLRAVVEQCRPQVLLCHGATEHLAHTVVASVEHVLVVNIEESVSDTRNHQNPKSSLLPRLGNNGTASQQQKHPAMILFTSGSTGVPKGVILTHEGLVNQVYGTTAFLSLGRETTLQQSPLGFDLMLDQIFLALCNGGTVCVVGKKSRGDPVQIASLMVRHKVTLTHFVPSEYTVLLNYGYHILAKTPFWRYAMSGGEPLRPNLVRSFRKLECENLELINVYGPAEITLACARGVVPYRDSIAEGDAENDCLLPSYNYQIEIVDANMNLLPVGFPGEICISGPGVGLGYLGRPTESEYSFLQRNSAEPHKRVFRSYRSGDMGRILPDGTLDVLGRIGSSRQIKINGFRVELDEIANTIIRVSHDAIANAAASWRPNQAAGTLVVFVVFDKAFSGNESEFLESLRANIPLPPYMKPRFIISIARMPSTPNGKIDFSAIDQLPITEPTELTAHKGEAPPLSETESAVKEIWEEVLADQKFPVGDNRMERWAIQPSSDFFQVGGSSILMMKLKSLLFASFGIAVPIPDLFHSSTLGAMSTLVTSLQVSRESDDAHSNGTRPIAFLRAGAQQVQDWDLEFASMLDGLPLPRSDHFISPGGSPGVDGGLVVVLTGATGFIGRHLLSLLVQHEAVAHVHCIAIRPNGDSKPRRLPLQHEKIIEYAGDLSDVNLGLSGAEFAFLAENADAIIHNGADVSLLKTYSSLRRTNVLSTRRLCEMALPRKVPVHYVSTASVAKVIAHDAASPLDEVAAVPRDTDLLNSVDGYAASKWASERLLERVTTDTGLTTYVHRLAHVVGDDASELDVVGMLTKYSLILRAIPRIEEQFVTGLWDFVFIREVASDMVAMIVSSQTGRDAATNGSRADSDMRIRFVNHCADAKTPHRDLGLFLEQLAGGPLKEIGMKEWVEGASAKGLHPLVREFFVAFEEGRGKLVLPVLIRSGRQT
ncbi:hybrid PKS-NRPS PsoA [Xylariaceae sp. FL0255]|nr:hybrid PKS-NRPS PsoA [Xylariaceae sp. FL0255]